MNIVNTTKKNKRNETLYWCQSKKKTGEIQSTIGANPISLCHAFCNFSKNIMKWLFNSSKK